MGILAPMLFTGGGSAVLRGGLSAARAATAAEALAEGANLAREAAPGVRSMLAGAAELTAPSLLSRAGGAVTKAAEQALEKEGASALSQALRKGAASALGNAVEGLGYATGDVIHQAQLDPDMTAEAMAAQIGLGGLLGGGIGGGLHLGGGALSAVAGKVGESELGAKLAGWLGEKEGQLNLKAAGAGEAELERAGNIHGREELNALGREMGELGLVTPYSTPAKTLGKAEALQEKAGGEIRTLLQRVDAKATPDVLPDAAGLFQRARTELIEPLEANALRPHEQEAAGRLRSLVDGLEQKLASEARAPASAATDALAGLASEGQGGIGADVRRALERVEGLNGELNGAPASGVGRVGFEQLHELRSQLTDAISDLSGAAEPATQAFRSGLQSLRTSVSDELGAAMERAGFSSKAWQQAERQYQVASLAAEFAEKGLERAKAASPFAPSKLLGTLQDIATKGLGSETLKALAKDQAGQLAPGLLSAGAKGLREVLEDPELSPVGRALMSKPRLPARLGQRTPEELRALEEMHGPAIVNALDWGQEGKGLGPVRFLREIEDPEWGGTPVSEMWRIWHPKRFREFVRITKAADEPLNHGIVATHPISRTFLREKMRRINIDPETGKGALYLVGAHYGRDLATLDMAKMLAKQAEDAVREWKMTGSLEAKARRDAVVARMKTLSLDSYLEISLEKDALPYGLRFEPGIGTKPKPKVVDLRAPDAKLELPGENNANSLWLKLGQDRPQVASRKDPYAKLLASSAKTEEEMRKILLSHEFGHHLHDVAQLKSLIRRAESNEMLLDRTELPTFQDSLGSVHDKYVEFLEKKERDVYHLAYGKIWG